VIARIASVVRHARQRRVQALVDQESHQLARRSTASRASAG
jgi:hypothetical protein